MKRCMIILKKRNPSKKNKNVDEGAKTVLKDCKKRDSNLYMACIGYKKVYSVKWFVLHSWINECKELFGIADNVRNFLEKSMEHLKLSLMSNDEDLGEVDVKRVIFKGDSLLPQLFVLSMVPLFHLLFINDLKLFFKSKEQIHKWELFMSFILILGSRLVWKKWGILTMKREVIGCEGIKLPNSEIMKGVEKEGYTFGHS